MIGQLGGWPRLERGLDQLGQQSTLAGQLHAAGLGAVDQLI